MLFAAYEQKGPVMIRYPRSNASDLALSRSPLVWGKAEEVAVGNAVSIWANGRELVTALAVAAILRTKQISASVINVRFLNPFDSERLFREAETKLVVTIEDSLHAGGLGRIVNDLLIRRTNRSVLHFSWDTDILPHGSVPLLREHYGLHPEEISSKILDALESRKERSE